MREGACDLHVTVVRLMEPTDTIAVPMHNAMHMTKTMLKEVGHRQASMQQANAGQVSCNAALQLCNVGMHAHHHL